MIHSHLLNLITFVYSALHLQILSEFTLSDGFMTALDSWGLLSYSTSQKHTDRFEMTTYSEGW